MTTKSKRPARARRPERTDWLRQAPEGSPSCRACGRVVELSQPQPKKPDELLGACTNPACGEWTIFRAVGDRLEVTRRIPASERQGDQWTPARPATAETAARA